MYVFFFMVFLLIVIVVLVFFGCGKVLFLMGEVGKGIIVFKKGVKDGVEEDKVEIKEFELNLFDDIVKVCVELVVECVKLDVECVCMIVDGSLCDVMLFDQIKF